MACTNAMTTPKLEHQMDTLQDYYMVARHVPMPARPSNSAYNLRSEFAAARVALAMECKQY